MKMPLGLPSLVTNLKCCSPYVGRLMLASEFHRLVNHLPLVKGSSAMPLLWSMNRCTHGVGLEYGGFIHTLPNHGCMSASSLTVYRCVAGKFQGSGSIGEATSRSNWIPRASNSHGGVYVSSVVADCSVVLCTGIMSIFIAGYEPPC